jgi:5'-nucleotidase
MGEMQLAFDERGVLTRCDGQASLLIGQQFLSRQADGRWAQVDDATQARILGALAHEPRVKALAPDAGAAALLQGYADQVATRKAQTIGTASESLCAVRVPGETVNRSAGVAGCETANQRAHGNDVAQHVAASFLHALPQADVAIINGGGVRVPLGAGPLTMNAAFTLLPFTNTLVQLPVTGQQLQAVLEDAVSAYLDGELSGGGSHPYAAGLRWHLDMTQPRGQRLSGLQVRDRASGEWQPIDPARTYQVATIDYLACGKDGYDRFAPLFASPQAINSYVLYTQAFVDYAMAIGTLGRPAPGDYSHQSVVLADGRQLPP